MQARARVHACTRGTVHTVNVENQLERSNAIISCPCLSTDPRLASIHRTPLFRRRSPPNVTFYSPQGHNLERGKRTENVHSFSRTFRPEIYIWLFTFFLQHANKWEENLSHRRMKFANYEL